MRLRKLRYPIVLIQPEGIIGGKNAGLASPRRWNYNVAKYYENGSFDDVVVIDASGNWYAVETIYLKKLASVSRALSYLFASGPRDDLAHVDAKLVYQRATSLSDFCHEIRETVLAHPEWWQRHSDMQEIEDLFVKAKTFAEAIHDIGVLDTSRRHVPKRRSNKVVWLTT